MAVKAKASKVIPISEIIEGGDNIRTALGDVTELAESIKRHGVLQPITVTKRNGQYLLVAGHRRLAASKLAGLTEIPATERDLDDIERAEVMVAENVHRKELNPGEEARAFKRLMDAYELSQQALANRLGLSQKTVSNKLRFLELPPEVQRQVVDGTIGLQRALNYHLRKHRGEWQSRPKKPSDFGLAQVFVVVGLRGGAQPPSVEVAANMDRAVELRDATTEAHKVFVFPVEIDRKQPSILESTRWPDEERESA